MSQLHDVAVGLDNFVGVSRSQQDEARNGPEGSKLFDRLVGRTVLAVPHGVVGEDEDHRQLHQGGKSNGRPRVIAEDKEGGAESPQFRQGESVDDGHHRMFAKAEVQISAAKGAGFEVPGSFELQRGFGGRGEIRRSAQQPRHVLREHVEHLARSLASRDALRIGGKCGQPRIPSARQLTALHQIYLERELWIC